MRLLLAFVLGLVIVGAASAQAIRDQSPEDLVNSIYENYVGKDDGNFDWGRKPLVDRIFEPKLARAVERDSRRGPEGFGADPFINGQDYQVKSAKLEAGPRSADKAEVTARLVNFDQPQTIVYDLVRTKTGWRVHDIVWDGNRTETFRKAMKVK